MAKDPAFLFYYQDFLVGTDYMTNEQIGAYIKCLCHQAHRGQISKEHMLDICKTSDIQNAIIDKFETDGNGFLFNQRLKDVVEKRKLFTESRRQNRAKRTTVGSHVNNTSKTSVSHMENENENKDKTKDGNENVKIIIEHLNNQTGQSYKTTTRKTIDCIKARHLEGFTVQDFIKVIDKKVKEWINDPEKCIYLRPETLFGSKFEGYLQQITKQEQTLEEYIESKKGNSDDKSE